MAAGTNLLLVPAAFSLLAVVGEGVDERGELRTCHGGGVGQLVALAGADPEVLVTFRDLRQLPRNVVLVHDRDDGGDCVDVLHVFFLPSRCFAVKATCRR